jgi:hypothetical protein
MRAPMRPETPSYKAPSLDSWKKETEPRMQYSRSSSVSTTAPSALGHLGLARMQSKTPENMRIW